MNITELFDVLPPWGFFLTSFIIIYGSIVIGLYLGKWTSARLSEGDKIDIGPVVTACLSLLAFLLAIVFGAVYSRYNELKHVVLDEANAIGTAFTRADLLPNADRTEVQRLLLDYTTSRLEAMQSGDREKIELAVAKSKELQAELWSIAITNAETNPTPLSALFIQSLNNVIDMHEKLITIGIHHRLPGDAYTMLLVLAFLAMALGGYKSGLTSIRRTLVVTLVAAVAYSLVFTYVFTLDHSHNRVSMQAPMIDLQEDIRRSMQLPN
jgi:hypothetical protein